MGYKEIEKNLSFADLAIAKSLAHNRSLKMMEKINAVVGWENIEALLLGHYEVGTSKEGADAFPPLLLMKCMLLQKCFRPGRRNPELFTEQYRKPGFFNSIEQIGEVNRDESRVNRGGKRRILYRCEVSR